MSDLLLDIPISVASEFRHGISSLDSKAVALGGELESLAGNTH
jgi:hypothetical protein